MENIIQKNDFIEIEFTGKSNGEVFDTINKDEAKKIGIETDVKPQIICVGNDMLLKGFDKAMEGKEIGKNYSVHLSSDESFGKRNPLLIKTMPMRVFKEKNITPYPGLTLQMDNYLVKIISVSGGRIIVDFNNPLAGKDIDYDFRILRKVTNPEEKINALQDFFFRMRFEFEYREKENKIVFKKSEIKPFIEIYKNKFKEMTGIEFDVEEKPKDETQKTDNKKELQNQANFPEKSP
jgi:FKBP-type peptidyl-prolyl cis-trans isomerase 2